jgi:uncharacterized protein YneF (UPF0154 family)
MLTFLAFDAPPSWGETVTIKDAFIGTVVAVVFFIALFYFTNRSERKSLAKKRQVSNSVPRNDHYVGKNPPPADETVHVYVLTTIIQAVAEFRYERKFSVDDMYYKLGKRYSRGQIKKALRQLADEGELDQVRSRKGNACFIRLKSA